MSKIAFVSDFHLFARRSTAEDYFDDVVAAAKASDGLVLGGDIFDFRWSYLGNPEKTADAAVDWLEQLIKAANETPVRFVFGNHDDHPLLHERFPMLQRKFEQFEWDRYFYREGDTIFLHGDVADSELTTTSQLEELRNSFEHGSRSPLHHKIYDLAVKAQLHRIAPPAVYPKKRVARRILNYIEHLGQGQATGLKHVCFGHTHRPINNYSLRGVTFHNCGAPIGQGKFRIVQRVVQPVETSPEFTQHAH